MCEQHWYKTQPADIWVHLSVAHSEQNVVYIVWEKPKWCSNRLFRMWQPIDIWWRIWLFTDVHKRRIFLFHTAFSIFNYFHSTPYFRRWKENLSISAFPCIYRHQFACVQGCNMPTHIIFIYTRILILILTSTQLTTPEVYQHIFKPIKLTYMEKIQIPTRIQEKFRRFCVNTKTR